MRAKYVYNVPDGAPFSAFEAVCDDIVNIFCGGSIAATSSYCVKAESFTTGASGGWTLVSKAPNVFQGFTWNVQRPSDRVDGVFAHTVFTTKPLAADVSTVGQCVVDEPIQTRGFLMYCNDAEEERAALRIIVPFTRIPFPESIIPVTYGTQPNQAVAMFNTQSVSAIANLHSLVGDITYPHAGVRLVSPSVESYIAMGYTNYATAHPRNFRYRDTRLDTAIGYRAMLPLDAGATPLPLGYTPVFDHETDTPDTYWDGVQFRGVCYERNFQWPGAGIDAAGGQAPATALKDYLCAELTAMYWPAPPYGFPVKRAFDQVTFGGDTYSCLPIFTDQWFVNVSKAPTLLLIRDD